MERGRICGAVSGVTAPVFVVSRGRAATAKTPALLTACGVPFSFLVEPQEAEAYTSRWPGAPQVVLADRDRGIGYARQFLLDHCRRLAVPRYWQLDDNINDFGHHSAYGHSNRREVPAAEALGAMEQAADEVPGGPWYLVAPEYRRWAWTYGDPYTKDAQVYCCTLTRTDSGINYRPEFDTKEDVEFALQHSLARKRTLRCNHWSMGKAPMGSQKGGLHEKYRAGVHVEAAKRLAAAYPDWVQLKEKRQGVEGVDAKVLWGKIRSGLHGEGVRRTVAAPRKAPAPVAQQEADDDHQTSLF